MGLPQKLSIDPAMPPDVRKAFGLPEIAFEKFWATPCFRGAARVPSSALLARDHFKAKGSQANQENCWAPRKSFVGV